MKLSQVTERKEDSLKFLLQSIIYKKIDPDPEPMVSRLAIYNDVTWPKSVQARTTEEIVYENMPPITTKNSGNPQIEANFEKVQENVSLMVKFQQFNFCVQVGRTRKKSKCIIVW